MVRAPASASRRSSPTPPRRCGRSPTVARSTSSRTRTPGRAIVTVFVDDLDATVAAIAARGLEPAERETYSNGVRKVTYPRPRRERDRLRRRASGRLIVDPHRERRGEGLARRHAAQAVVRSAARRPARSSARSRSAAGRAGRRPARGCSPPSSPPSRGARRRRPRSCAPACDGEQVVVGALPQRRRPRRRAGSSRPSAGRGRRARAPSAAAATRASPRARRPAATGTDGSRRRAAPGRRHRPSRCVRDGQRTAARA